MGLTDQVSTLANILSGKSGYNISGKINYQGKSMMEFSVDELKKGIFLAFQYPLEISGVNCLNFLKTSFNSIRKANGKKEINTISFLNLVKRKQKNWYRRKNALSRQLNVGFSGGEKKNEILQMKILEPKLVILDETDSGLDIDALKIIADGVNSSRSEDRSF